MIEFYTYTKLYKVSNNQFSRNEHVGELVTNGQPSNISCTAKSDKLNTFINKPVQNISMNTDTLGQPRPN